MDDNGRLYALEKELRAEYDRCINYMQNPDLAPDLFDVSGIDAVIRYYSYRAEGIGFALDRINSQ